MADPPPLGLCLLRRRRLRPPAPGDITMLSAYVGGRMYLIMAVTGLGYLALLWSTAVLLGGFVTALQKKDFWCLTTISMLQAASIFNDLREQLFFKLLKLLLRIPTCIFELSDYFKWNYRALYETYRRLRSLLSSHCCLSFVLAGPVFILLVLIIVIYVASCLLCGLVSWAFFFVMTVYGFLGPIACFALALWRILQPDYGDTDGDASKGNLKPALMMFYWLILCQFVLYLLFIIANGFAMFLLVPLVRRYSKLTQEWGTKSVRKYLSDTGAKCWREGNPVSISGRSLSRYAADLLDSESWEDNLFGARMLATFIRQGTDVRSLLLPSRPKIQKLIDTLGWRGRGNREMRECAAGIVADIAGDIHLPHFPEALRCISSLLQDQTTSTYWDIDQQVGDDGGRKNWFDLFLEKYLDWDSYYQQVDDDGGCNKLIVQGLAILERLASSDHNNCNDICSAPGLLPKITAPLYSSTFSGDINISDWAKVVNAALKVIYQLIIHAPREISTRLRLDIITNEQAMSNLKVILDQGTGIELKTQQEQLLMRAMEILTELALDSSVDLSSETKENLIKKQLQIFLADEGGQEPTSLPSRIIQLTAGRTLVLISKYSHTNSDFIMRGYHYILAHLKRLLDTENDIVYRTIAVEILENLCTHCDWNKHKQIVKESLLPKVLEEIMSIKTHQPESKTSGEKENKPRARRWWTLFKRKNNPGNQKTSAAGNNRENQKNSAPGNDEENQQNFQLGTEEQSQQNCAPGDKNEIQEISSGDQKNSSDQQNEEQTAKRKLQEALLSLALVICDKLISADDVIQENSLGGDFVMKLKTIIDDNCQPRADSLRIVKLCGQIAASMMQYQPYAELFKNKDFVQSLSKASKIMSSLESCMMFAGTTDFRLTKTVRPLLFEVVSELEQKVLKL